MTVKICTFKLGSEWFSLAYGEDLRLVANSFPSDTSDDSIRHLIRSLIIRGVRGYIESQPDQSIISNFRSALSGMACLNLSFDGFSGFQRRVLGITSKIPSGQVTTYRNIAIAIGRPKSHRAVGNVLARNPFPILIPCHRVVRSDLSLGGYSGPHGKKIKERLLRLEGVEFSKGRVMERFLLAPDKLSYRSSLCP